MEKTIQDALKEWSDAIGEQIESDEGELRQIVRKHEKLGEEEINLAKRINRLDEVRSWIKHQIGE